MTEKDPQNSEKNLTADELKALTEKLIREGKILPSQPRPPQPELVKIVEFAKPEVKAGGEAVPELKTEPKEKSENKAPEQSDAEALLDNGSQVKMIFKKREGKIFGYFVGQSGKNYDFLVMDNRENEPKYLSVSPLEIISLKEV